MPRPAGVRERMRDKDSGSRVRPDRRDRRGYLRSRRQVRPSAPDLASGPASRGNPFLRRPPQPRRRGDAMSTSQRLDRVARTTESSDKQQGPCRTRAWRERPWSREFRVSATRCAPTPMWMVARRPDILVEHGRPGRHGARSAANRGATFVVMVHAADVRVLNDRGVGASGTALGIGGSWSKERCVRQS